MANPLAATVERMLLDATSAAHVIDDLSMAVGIVIGTYAKPEHLDTCLATAGKAIAESARKTSASLSPGVQRQ